MGDFNTVYESSHRLNGSLVSAAEMEDCLDTLQRLNLTPLKSFFFSWSNKSEGMDRILSRIDHAFGDDTWMDKFAEQAVIYGNPGVSDHCPLVLSVADSPKGGGRPFRFFNYLADHSNFENIVESVWQQDSKFTGMQKVWFKLKLVKNELKLLHKQEFAGIQERIKKWRDHLSHTQLCLQNDPNDVAAQTQEKEAIHALKFWLHTEESAIKQKSRIN
jgi:hypothetical protein